MLLEPFTVATLILLFLIYIFFILVMVRTLLDRDSWRGPRRR